MPQHAWVDGNLTVHDWLATVPNVPPVVDLAYQPVAKVIRAAGEQEGESLRRRNSPVSLRILLRCGSLIFALLLTLAVEALSPQAATAATGRAAGPSPTTIVPVHGFN